MYRVLIAEDEMLVRMGLKNSVNWPKYDMTVIADAADGKTALEIYEREKPDIIITDLKMPIMDGIELIRNIREKDQKTRIVIITCLDEFDLAKKAISLNVSGYILKLDMTTEEMEEILLKLRSELESIDILRQTLPDENQDLVKENIMKNYIFYKLYSEEEFEFRIKGLKISLNPNRLIMCIMEIKHYDMLEKKFADGRGQLIKFSLMNVIGEVLKGSNRAEVFHDAGNRYIFIFSFYDLANINRINEELKITIDRIYRVMNTFFNISVFFGISSIQNRYAKLSDMYDECKNACNLSYFMGDENSMDWNMLNEKACLENSLVRQIDSFEKLYEDGLINENQKKHIIEKLNVIFDNSDNLREQVTGNYIKTMEWFLGESDIIGDEKFKILMQYTSRLKDCETFTDAINTLYSYVLELKYMSSSKRFYCKGINDVIKNIHQNYWNELSANELAEKVGLTPNYLSSLFKKEVGMNMFDYINKVRMIKAKELLLETNLKSYEIAEKVGFADDSYFSKIFKRFTGVRPNEYRRYHSSLNI